MGMKITELLAPAGDIEAGYAALFFGADAVYLGLKSFSARAGAVNFSPEELNELTAYAHHLGRKVYVAVNTVLQEHELPALLKTLDVCSSCQVDAVILQDLGVARVVQKEYPELSMHASTQMAVHNKEGALALKKLGFSRVVLARELTLPEIKEIADIPDLETEAFIHGALCYAYSGLCLFSSVMAGRSANRGKCQYPCRALFEKNGQMTHCFSMKDMALCEDVLKMPVTSLKIEGRKKKALYVAAVVDYYRQILDTGRACLKKEEQIKQIFSRAWTKFHLNGKNLDVIDPDFVGHRGLVIGQVEKVVGRKLSFVPTHTVCRYDGLQIDLPNNEKPFGFSVQEMMVQNKNVFEAKAGQRVQITLPPHSPFMPKGSSVYLASSSFVKGAYAYDKPKPKQFQVRPQLDVLVQLGAKQVCVKAGSVCRCLDGGFLPAQNIDKMNESVIKTFQKDGDFAFEAKVKVVNSDGVFVPVSVLNQLRREVYEAVELCCKKGVLPLTEERSFAGTQWIVKTDALPKIAALNADDFAEIILEVQPDFCLDDLKKWPKNKIRLALPTVCRQPDSYQTFIQKALALGYRKWEVGNWWGKEILPAKGIDLSFDTSLYMLNTQAVQYAKEMGVSRVSLSVEDTLDNLEEVAAKSCLPMVLVVYQDIPLFISANCIKKECASCRQAKCVLPLKKDGQTFLAKLDKCQLTLFHKDAFYIGQERNGVKADFYRVDFVGKDYAPETVLALWQKIRLGTKMPATIQANLKRSI